MNHSQIEFKVLSFIGDKASFDMPIFLERLSEGQDWSKLIVAHIYLDHIVTRTLHDHLPFSDRYLNGYRSFPDKLSVCQALGYFRGEFGKLLTAINNSRNKFAHKLIFDVSDQEKKNLFRAFSETRPLTEVTHPEGFENFLMTIVIWAEFERISEKKKKDLTEERQALIEEMIALLANDRA